MKNHNTR